MYISYTWSHADLFVYMKVRLKSKIRTVCSLRVQQQIEAAQKGSTRLPMVST